MRTLHDHLHTLLQLARDGIHYHETLHERSANPINHAAVDFLQRLATIAEGITYDCDDGREHVALGNEYREMVSTPDHSRSYGLRWSVDGETSDDAEAEALLVLASALRCRYLQEVAPCL